MKIKKKTTTRSHINVTFDIEYDERKPERRPRFYHEQSGLKSIIDVDDKETDDIKDGQMTFD